MAPMAGSGQGVARPERPAGFRALLASLDRPTRRKLARLTLEIALLTIVVGVVYGGPALRGGARPPSATAPPAVRVPTLGLASNEITIVFSMDRFGEFEFGAEDRVDGVPLLAGSAADGATRLELWGDPADLRRVVMTFDLSEPGVVDGAQRGHISALLALFAPNALEPLLAELRAALDEGRSARETIASGRIAARLDVPADGSRVTVLLLPARQAGDQPEGAASPRVSASPVASPSPEALATPEASSPPAA